MALDFDEEVGGHFGDPSFELLFQDVSVARERRTAAHELHFTPALQDVERTSDKLFNGVVTRLLQTVV